MSIKAKISENPEVSPGVKTALAPAGTRKRISATVVNFWVDCCVFVMFAVLGWVSATLQFAFPAPTAADGWKLWGLTYDQWRDIQFGALSLFAGSILLHVMLHWKWVCSVFATQILRTKNRPDDGMQTIYGVATLIVILHIIGAGVVIAMLCVQRPPE